MLSSRWHYRTSFWLPLPALLHGYIWKCIVFTLCGGAVGTDARLSRVTEVVGVTRVVGATVGVTVTTSAAKGLVLVGVATTPGTTGFEGTTTAAPRFCCCSPGSPLPEVQFTHLQTHRCVDLSGIWCAVQRNLC